LPYEKPFNQSNQSSNKVIHDTEVDNKYVEYIRSDGAGDRHNKRSVVKQQKKVQCKK